MGKTLDCTQEVSRLSRTSWVTLNQRLNFSVVCSLCKVKLQYPLGFEIM